MAGASTKAGDRRTGRDAQQRVALVSGGNRGIGYAICRALARKGCAVVLGARSAAEGTAAAQALQAEGLTVEFRLLDVARDASVRACVTAVMKRHGRIDILVNNAGVLLDPKGSRVLDSHLDVYRDTLKVNFYGALRLAQAVAPLMRKARYGRIVNMSSGLGQLSGMETGAPAYRVSKTALNALTRMLAAELKDTGVLVNSMCPGWVRTRMGGRKADRTPEQAADTAVWLAMLPPSGPSGGFFRDRKRLPW
ncbi:MAG TPA: SDR family oxidoreductase [Burkholderiales bacterium]|nr:SDR family oxidoreductase [Burkholderiales bacterium]